VNLANSVLYIDYALRLTIDAIAVVGDVAVGAVVAVRIGLVLLVLANFLALLSIARPAAALAADRVLALSFEEATGGNGMPIKTDRSFFL